MARSVLALSAPRAVTAPASSGSRSGRPALAGTGPLRLSTSIATSPSPWNTTRHLTRDNYSYRESTAAEVPRPTATRSIAESANSSRDALPV